MAHIYYITMKTLNQVKFCKHTHIKNIPRFLRKHNNKLYLS